jgi:hypothetical protein
MKVPPAARVSLGGVEFLLSAGEIPLRLESDDAYRSFLVVDPAVPEASSAVRIQHALSPSPSFEGEAIFESDASWSILARGSERALAFRHPDGEMLFVAAFRPGSPDVLIQCAPRLLGSDSVLTSPFRYPLDQVLSMYLLGERGIVVHAAGALVRGWGLAFAGVSGAGKSTLTGLAAGRAGWTALSDDRVIVRTGSERPILHGTPWPGEGRSAANRAGPLAGLLFLEQGSSNEIRRLGSQDALARLLRTTSVPWYDAEYVGGVLGACGAAVAGAPPAALTFRREVGAVEAVERFLGECEGALRGLEPA